MWCIAKGKVHKKFEFGCKVPVARTALSGIIVGMKSFTRNRCDGDKLAPALQQVQRLREYASARRLYSRTVVLDIPSRTAVALMEPDWCRVSRMRLIWSMRLRWATA